MAIELDLAAFFAMLSGISQHTQAFGSPGFWLYRSG